MYPALSAASVTMANTGKMRGSAAESSKKSAVSKLLLKPTRLPKTAAVAAAASSGVKGRDNLGFVPGPGRSEAGMDMASPGTALTRSSTSTGANDPSHCRVDDVEIPRLEQTSTKCGPGTRQNPLLAVAERQSPINEEQFFIRGCDEMIGESTFRRIPEEEAYSVRPLSAVRNEMELANAIPLSKCGSTTALETLSSRRSESPIYEELDFRCASFRDLNSDTSRILESPNVSDSSSELSNPRRGLPFATRHMEHRGQYSSPSCGVRIAEMRATRKYDGLRISPSSTTNKPVVQHRGIGAGIDRTRSQPNGKGSPAPNDTTFRRSFSSQAQGGENHRSSLDLNVTYVEYFDETRDPSTGSQTTSICSPAASSHSSSASSLAETANRISSSSSSQMNFLKGHRRTATSSSVGAERDCQAASLLRIPPKFVETSTQTGGGPAKEKRQIRPIGFTGLENRFTKSSAIRKTSEADKRQESGTGFLCGRFTDSSSRPLSVRRSISEPDGGPSDGSGSILSSPNSTDTLMDSEISLAEEDTANDDLASSEATDDDNNTHHSIRPEPRPSLGIRAAQKRPQPSPPARIPSYHLQGPTTTTTTQRRHPPDPSQSAAKTPKSSAQLMTSSSSCLTPRQGTASQQQQQQNSPAPPASTSPTKLSIQRIENFGQVAESKNMVSVAQPVKLTKSTSSTDLNKNSSHLQTSISRRIKPIGNTIGLPSDCVSVSKTQNPRPKIPPSPTPVRTTVRRVQVSDSRPAPVSKHSSNVCASSTSSSKSGSKSVSTVKRDSGSASTRSDERSRVIGCPKDSQSSTAQLRSIPSNAPVAASNKLMRQHTVPPTEGSGKHLKPCGRLPSASDNLVIPFSLQQQQLSPIAERSPLPRTSTSSGESISGNVNRNCRGQVSPRVLPFTGANSTATQFHRNLSSSQRTLSLSKISSAKSTSPVTGGASTKCEIRRPINGSDAVASVSSTKPVSEDSISKTSEISNSYANIFEQSSAAKENSPSRALQRTVADGRRLNAASCVALNVCPEPHKPVQNKVPDRSRESTRTNESDMRSELSANSSTPSSADAQIPDNAKFIEPKETRGGIPVRAERRKEAKPSGIAEWTGPAFSSRLRTPTDFNNGKKSEKSNDREISTPVRRSPRTSTSQTISDRNEESEAVITPTSVFKQLQLKHVKPYTSASNRGTSIAEKFARSRSTVESGNVRYKMAASVERNSGANCHDLKTVSNVAMPSVVPSTQPTGPDSSSVTSNIKKQENPSDNLVPNSQSCDLDNSPEAAIKTETNLSDTDRKTCQREDDVGSSCGTPESSSRMHSVSSFECTDTSTSDKFKMDSYARNDDVFDENRDTDAASENTIRVSQEIDSRSVPIARTIGHTDHTQVTQPLVSEPRATGISSPDPIQPSASSSDINASLSSQIQSGNSQKAETETDADAEDVADRSTPYTTISSQCIFSETDYSSVQLSGDELFSETECFESTTKGSSDCGVASDFSDKTLQRECKGVSESSSSMEQGTSDSFDVQQSDVTDAETLTDEDCFRSCSAAEITSQLSSDLSTPRKSEKVKMDHGSQTMLSDVGCLGDSILRNPSNRNSLILQNKIIVDQDTPLRDIEKFVVTYESANIIVLERADSISCPAPRDLKDELYDRSSRSDLSASLTSTEIGQKWGKNNSMSSSRSVDLRTVTSPKGESGNLPLSESGYDSWKSQSSKSSMRFLKLSDSEACAVSGGSNLSETVNRRLEGTYDRRSKDSELRRSGTQLCFGVSAGYVNGCSSKGRPVDGNCTIDAGGIVSSATSRKLGSVENRLKCGSSGSETEVNLRQEMNNDADIRRLGLPSLSDISSADGGEIDASCNYFQDDDDVSLIMQASATVEDCFRIAEAEEGGGGFSSSFSSFPSSSSSLMDTLESMSLNRSDSNEGFAEVWTGLSTGGPPDKLCLHPPEEKHAWSICTESTDRPVDLIDFACGSCYELSSNAAAFHSRDYHNRIYKLDFGAGDSGDLAIDPEELDLGDEQEDPLLPSSTWLEERNVQSSGKIPDQPDNSAVEHKQPQSSLKNCSNSKSGPLRPISRDFGDQNSKQSVQPEDIHSYTFPLAIRKVPTEGGMREEEEARTVAENCHLFSRLNVKSRRKQEKETFYENMCDELLESLEANLSDSDNTPSPTARDLHADSDELTCVGKNFNSLAATSREKLALHNKKTISSEEDKAVMPISSDDSTLSAKDKRTHCRWHINEPSINAIHFQLLESGQEKSTYAKSASEQLPVRGKAICQTPTTSAREASTDSVPHTTIVSVEPSGLDSQMYERNQGKEAAPSDSSLSVPKELLWVSQYCVEEQKPEDVRVKLSMVDCKETSSDTQQVCPSICNLAEGSLKDGLNQRPNANSLATLPLGEPEVVIRSSDCSPSDAATTLPSKDEMKSASSAGLLTRYFPGLLRRQSRDRHASPETAERRSGRKHDEKFTFSRNSAPVSYDRKSKDITEQEPRSVRDVIRKFEDKTAAQTAATPGEGSRSSIAAEKPSSEEHKGSSSKRSKFSKKTKS